ncbi:50S ribosomal protein L29 [Sediminispirochaeta smaragdinae]|uniref:Large ribosomal subunit protein uL29 n=1 Tax=Sediminispirochaeta smaragdinae (strain DSM 11293 / JCM 15392 / SEBR 4228) TaxID=573413 RepID=E1RCL7_SEDSS|nr:50S ribosomal protein L29 [Sediminispirochaeta smaragdinae]ADK80097.1 ribosomal protein L29 [Sediminispirochaeta smaragdinae DSM 11293]
MKDSFKDLTYQELVEKREELRKKYLDLRVNKVIGHMENRLEIRTVRRRLASLNGIIHEYALGIRKES